MNTVTFGDIKAAMLEHARVQLVAYRENGNPSHFHSASAMTDLAEEMEWDDMLPMLQKLHNGNLG